MYISKSDKSLKNNITESIIIINVVIFLATLSFEHLTGSLAIYLDSNFKVYQILTHMFTHSGVLHIFFNMYALYIFGKPLEKRYGIKKFLTIYFISGIGAVLLHFLFNMNSHIPMVGASGCIYGIVASYVFLYPKQKLGIIFLPFRFEAWKFILVILGIEFILGILNITMIGHFAHIGGALTGYLISVYYKYKSINK